MLKLSRMYKWWVALCIAGLVLAGCAPSSSPAATREDKWRQDLKVLATELPRRHKNLFFQMSKDEFELSSADYFAGRDPVLEAALTYQEK